jgi:hypothetical protein
LAAHEANCLMVTFARACPGRGDDTRGSSGRTASAPSRTQTRARQRRARARPTAARCCCCSAARAWLCTAISGESPRRPCSRTAGTRTPPSAPVSPSRTAASGRRRRRSFRSSLLTLSAALRLPEQPNEVHDGLYSLGVGRGGCLWWRWGRDGQRLNAAVARGVY